VVDLGERGAIATGIGFLNHMIDQLTSHAQLGVSVCEVVSVRTVHAHASE
jgi:imidazoleglycerol phosphate dehydratase HisB